VRVPRSIHSYDYKKFTTILLDARHKAGLTQQEVADRLGKPQSYVAKVEGNERRIDVVEFIALANALGIDPTRLFSAVLTSIEKPRS